MRTIGSRSYLKLVFIALAFIGLAIPVGEALSQSPLLAHPWLDTVPVVPHVHGPVTPAPVDPVWPTPTLPAGGAAPDTSAAPPADVTAYGNSVMTGTSTLQKDAIPIWND